MQRRYADRYILQSYYKVARKRFVDNVVKQAADHILVRPGNTSESLHAKIREFVGT
jgi:hypothetical protein